MKQMFKDNPMLVFGIGLPLVLVVVFAVASALTRATETPPAYDVIYTTGYTPNSHGSITMQVVDKHLVVNVIEEACYYSTPRLFRYRAKENVTEEIKINLPPEIVLRNTSNCVPNNKGKITAVEIPELKDVLLDASAKSPDGYEFFNNQYRSGEPILLTGIFFGGYGRHNNYSDGVLRKGNYDFRLPQKSDYYMSSTFLGWVKP